jgi:hypothetical protein
MRYGVSPLTRFLVRQLHLLRKLPSAFQHSPALVRLSRGRKSAAATALSTSPSYETCGDSTVLRRSTLLSLSESHAFNATAVARRQLIPFLEMNRGPQLGSEHALTNERLRHGTGPSAM